MSVETDDGPYTALEDQTVDPPADPAPVPPTPDPAPVVTAPPSVPKAPAEREVGADDLEALAVPDRLTHERMVPLHEVVKLREKARTLKAERETVSARVAELEAKAAETDGAREVARQWKAYADSLVAQRPRSPQPDPQGAERQQQADAARRVR